MRFLEGRLGHGGFGRPNVLDTPQLQACCAHVSSATLRSSTYEVRRPSKVPRGINLPTAERDQHFPQIGMTRWRFVALTFVLNSVPFGFQQLSHRVLRHATGQFVSPRRSDRDAVAPSAAPRHGPWTSWQPWRCRVGGLSHQSQGIALNSASQHCLYSSESCLGYPGLLSSSEVSCSLGAARSPLRHVTLTRKQTHTRTDHTSADACLANAPICLPPGLSSATDTAIGEHARHSKRWALCLKHAWPFGFAVSCEGPRGGGKLQLSAHRFHNRPEFLPPL